MIPGLDIDEALNQFQKPDLVYTRKSPSEYLSHCVLVSLFFLQLNTFLPDTGGKGEEAG